MADVAEDVIRVAVRAKPGARRDHVGGSYGADRALVVAVRQRAVDGAANEAVVAVLARALGVRRSRISLLSGLRSRDKVVEISGVGEDTGRLVEELRSGRPAAG